MMILGAGSTIRTLATVSTPIGSVSGISGTSATFIFIGVIFFFAGIGLYLKNK
jgi:hypothetical protein